MVMTPHEGFKVFAFKNFEGGLVRPKKMMIGVYEVVNLLIFFLMELKSSQSGSRIKR